MAMIEFPQLPEHDYRAELAWRSDGRQGSGKYTSPSGENISFCISSIKAEGGQSLDTAPHPSSGSWSSRATSVLPHKFSVSVRMVGADYHLRRRQLIPTA